MFFQKFFRDHKRRIFVALLFLLPLTPFVLKRLELPRLHINDAVNSFIVHPVAGTLSNARAGIHYIWSSYFMLVGAKAENEELQKKVAELERQLLNLGEISVENSRLRRLLAIPELSEYQSITARIIGQDSNSEVLSFFINVGSQQGVEERMPVVTDRGAVGSIRRVFRNSAIFVSVLDPTHTVDAYIERSRARMIVEGGGAPLYAELKYLDRAHDVKVGDQVLTSGIDSSFPKGLRIGYVVELNKPRHGVLQSAKLRAAVDPGKLEEVVVLKYKAMHGAIGGL